MPTEDGRNKSEGPTRQELLEMARGFARGKVLCAAVRLGVADALGDGCVALADLAAATATDPGALLRLLRVLASMGIVQEDEMGRFALTASGRPLRRDAPDWVWASMIFWADLIADAWTYLPDCIRTGDRSGVEAAQKRDGTVSRWSIEPNPQAIFHSVFAEPAAEDFSALVAACDLSGCRGVADLGGAGGGLLSAVLAAHPEAHGILIDRQEAIDKASKRFEASGLSSRCECVVADLLETPPPAADIYLMRSVLHGYDDEAAAKILRNVRSAMIPESRLLIIEVVLPDRVAGSDPKMEALLMSDLNMLAVTGGRERSEKDWRALLESADLCLKRLTPAPYSPHTIIEATVSA